MPVGPVAVPVGRRALLSVVALAGAGMLTGCGGDDVYLPALERDPMSTWAPTGGREVESSSIGYDPGSGSRKPRQARVLRTFELGSPAEADAAVAAALTRAGSAGWASDALGREGYRTRSGPHSSTVTLSVLKSAVSDVQVVVTLTAP